MVRTLDQYLFNICIKNLCTKNTTSSPQLLFLPQFLWLNFLAHRYKSCLNNEICIQVTVHNQPIKNLYSVKNCTKKCTTFIQFLKTFFNYKSSFFLDAQGLQNKGSRYIFRSRRLKQFAQALPIGTNRGRLRRRAPKISQFHLLYSDIVLNSSRLLNSCLGQVNI